MANPFDYLSQMSGGGFGPEAEANRMLAGGREAGFFSPFGSPMLRSARRRSVLANRDALQRRNRVSSRISGVDPMQARGALFNADIYGAGQTADALNQAELGDMTSNRDFLQGLFRSELDFRRQRQLQKEQQKAQEKAGWGQLLGYGVSKFIPGF